MFLESKIFQNYLNHVLPFSPKPKTKAQPKYAHLSWWSAGARVGPPNHLPPPGGALGEAGGVEGHADPPDERGTGADEVLDERPDCEPQDGL